MVQVTVQLSVRRIFPVLLALLFSATVSAKADAKADAKAEGPYEVVAKTTERVTEVIEEARDYVNEDPERYYDQVENILADVVDFKSFAMGVMGKHGSRSYYASLSEEERKVFWDRVERFTAQFRHGLIRSYAKGLLAFNGNRIEVLPLDEDTDLDGSVNVEQHIYGDAPQPYVVYYKMKRNSDGEWKLRNVSIGGTNLGVIYKNQFASAVKRYDGDIDKVIDNWSVSAATEDAGDDGGA